VPQGRAVAVGRHEPLEAAAARLDRRDGRDVGVVRVDARSPTSRLRTTVAATGRHDYRLESVRQVKGRPPERTTGRSEVVIAGKRLLGIYYGPDGKVYLLAER